MVMVRGDEGRGHTRQVARECCSQQFSTHPPLFALHQPGIDATRLGGGHTNDLRGRSAGAAATRSRGARCGEGAQHLVSPALYFRPTVGRSCGGRRPRTGEAECGAAADRRRPGEGRQRAGEAHGRVGESGTCWKIGSGVDRGAPLPFLSLTLSNLRTHALCAGRPGQARLPSRPARATFAPYTRALFW